MSECLSITLQKKGWYQVINKTAQVMHDKIKLEWQCCSIMPAPDQHSHYIYPISYTFRFLLTLGRIVTEALQLWQINIYACRHHGHFATNKLPFYLFFWHNAPRVSGDLLITSWESSRYILGKFVQMFTRDSQMWNKNLQINWKDLQPLSGIFYVGSLSDYESFHYLLPLHCSCKLEGWEDSPLPLPCFYHLMEFLLGLVILWTEKPDLLH